MRKIVTLAVLILVATAFKMQDDIEDPQQCIEQKCPTEWAACQKNPKCVPDLQDCQKKCGTKQSCWELCLGGKKDTEATNVAKCAAKNDCLKETRVAVILNTPQECIEKYCKTEEQTCEKDRSCIRTLEFCNHRCGNNSDCWKKCLAEAKNVNADKYIKCIVDHDCMNQVESTAIAVRDPQQCIEQKCPTEWAACQKNPKCVPDLQDCQKKCGTKQSCWELCLGGKKDTEATNVAKCAAKNDCLKESAIEIMETAVALVSPQDCIREKCPDQAKACQQDPACLRALQDCEHECNNNQTCWSNCVAKKGNPAASAFWKCIIDNDCLNQVESTAVAVQDPQQCIEEKCPTEWAACQKNPKCVPDLQDCQKKCGTKQSCWELCLGGKKDNEATNVAKCAAKNDCLKETRVAVMPTDPQKCIEDKCPKEWAACLQDPKCQPALDDCMKKCGTKVSCWSLCLPPKGSQAAIDVAKCAQANDCLNQVEILEKAVALVSPQDCIREHCPDQSHTCSRDPKCLRILQDCEHYCKDNQTCWSGCVSKAGNANASAFWKCVVDNDCMNKVEVAVALLNPHECLEQKCPDEWKACEQNAQCIPDLHDCHKRCGDKKSCWELCLSGKKDDAATNVMKCGAQNHCFGNQIRKSKKETRVALSLEDPQECIEKYCKNEEQACENDRRCIRTLEFCDNRCNTTQSCWKDCLERAKEPNATHYMVCLVKNHCINPSTCKKSIKKATTAVAIVSPQDCIREKCPDQAKACQQDPACLRALQDCEHECNNNQTCWSNCVAKKGNPAASAFWKCIIDNDCLNQVTKVSDPVDCVKEKCPNEYNACVKDSKCEPTLDKCNKKCGTSKSCWQFCLAGADSTTVNVAKCAAANHCVGGSQKEVHPFLQCMQKTCITVQLECLYDKDCSKAVRKCMKHEKFSYDHKCLSEKAKESEKVSSWYRCAGESFCL